MAAPAPRRVPLSEPRVEEPPTDPTAYQRALRRERARRRARTEHEYELKRARFRFLVLLLALLFLAAFISLSIWAKVQALFGI
jgi:hypothetical protein